MILRWLAIGSIFLVINAVVIVLMEDEGRFRDTGQTGLPEDVLLLIQQDKTNTF